MAAYAALRFLIATGIVAGLSCVQTSDAAERYRDSKPSFWDFFNRDRVKRRDDDTYRKRRYVFDDDFFTRPAKKRIKRKRYAGPVQVVEEKPEPPLVYQPEKLETLRAADLKQPVPAEPLGAAIYGELKNKRSAIRVTLGERQALVDFYRQNGFRAVWVSNQGLGERGRSVLRLFETSAEDGLTPEDYLPPSLARFDDDLSVISDDIARLARLDLEISARALRYARHLSGGRLIPNKLTKYHDITPETVDLAAAMKVFLRSPSPAGYLSSLQPDHPAYAVFKKELARLQEFKSEARSGMIGPGKRVKPGQDDPRIALLRRYLSFLDYGEADALPGDETVLDDVLSERLKAFQTDAGIKKPTGALDAATIVALNTRIGTPGITRIVYNMERLRWLPKDLGKRHVFVNQAAYMLKVVYDGREIWRTKVIVGKPNSQTVAFSDKMETIVFNPSWGVPPSIMKNEMIPKLRRDPGYLDRIGYRVLTPGGKIVRSRSVSWWKYKDGKVPYLIQQPPGDDNALGEIKFLFPNIHSIYMHDTPTRDLFKKPVRAMSHGCVRVENPRLFAEVLLGADAVDIAARIDSGVSEGTPVARETAVHLTYFTAWPAEDGRITYYDDIYGRDERMQRAFTSVSVASR